MQVCTFLQTDNHASTPPLCFLQAGCPFCRPTNSVKALKAPRYKLETVKIIREVHRGNNAFKFTLWRELSAGSLFHALITRSQKKVVVVNFDFGERFPRRRSQQQGSLRWRWVRQGVAPSRWGGPRLLPPENFLMPNPAFGGNLGQKINWSTVNLTSMTWFAGMHQC